MQMLCDFKCNGEKVRDQPIRFLFFHVVTVPADYQGRIWVEPESRTWQT
jgi:hypothetical protein